MAAEAEGFTVEEVCVLNICGIVLSEVLVGEWAGGVRGCPKVGQRFQWGDQKATEQTVFFVVKSMDGQVSKRRKEKLAVPDGGEDPGHIQSPEWFAPGGFSCQWCDLYIGFAAIRQ